MKLRILLLSVASLIASNVWPQLVVNEVMTSNLDVCLDPSWNYGGWIELYNSGMEDFNLQGIYVSDDENNLKRFRLPAAAGKIPAKGFGCIWFDHYDWLSATAQVPFKLDAEGGIVYLSDAQGNIILSINYPAAMPRCSWARVVDVSGDWSWTANPTPATSNSTSTFASTQAKTPILYTQSQLFNGLLTVSVSWPEEYTIRYTTDGTIPTETNGKVLIPHSLMITQTTIFRFRAFCEGLLPSDVVTRSFILQEHDYKIPVLSVVANSEDLYGTDYGLFAKGPHGRTGRGETDPCNWNMDWDRAANVELIDPQSGMLLNQQADIAPSGGCSRSWMPTPFKITASKLYGGNNFFDYAIFEQKPFLQNKSFKARNGGNDWYDRFRDPALQMIVGRSGINIDYQEYQPVQHYVNGEYKGVINLRETNNKHFVRANHGWDDDEIDMFEIDIDSGYVQMYGDRRSFDLWCDLAHRCGKDESAYDELTEMVDVEEMAYYLALEFYLANGDWPFNNIKAFRPRVDGGKWRFVLFDLDGCLSISDVFTHFEHYHKHAVVQLTLDMLKNQRFRKLFTDAFCVMAGSVFEPTRCLAIATELNDLTWNEIHYEEKSPSYSYNLIKSSLSAQRQISMVDEMRTYLKLTDLPHMKVNVGMAVDDSFDDDVCGRLLYNDLPIPTGKFSGKAVAPVTLRAEAAPGYRFLGWRMVGNEVEKTLIHKGDKWRYYDEGSLDGTAWNTVSYDDSSWRKGAAPLGYNSSNSNIVTRMDYGNKNDRRPTYYLRSTVTLDRVEDLSISLNYHVDDGLVLYVNGREALRYRMPDGTPDYSTFAISKSIGNPDKNKTTLDPSLFVPGDNIIAIELHNYASTDDDIYWDASLSVTYRYSGKEHLLCVEPEFTLPEGTDMNLEAVFGRMDDQRQRLMPLRINEVSASNDIYVNDYWKRNDWIEIYNISDEDFDLTDMYLSDDLGNPLKYQIPASATVSNVVPAHGFRVVWCDKQDPLTQMHAHFKLRSDSGYVVLTHRTGALADTLRYCRQDRDVTVGRYPDGGENVYVMQRPTIGKANMLTLCDTLYQQLHIVPTRIEEVGAEPVVIDVQYVTLSGIAVPQPTSGIYIRRETLSDGTVRAMKMIIK